MIKNYPIVIGFKTTFRNLWRNKTFTVSYMAGLAVCLAVFFFIFDHLSTYTPIGHVIYFSSFSFAYFTIQNTSIAIKYFFVNENWNNQFNTDNQLTGKRSEISSHV